ncbi:MAG TPA: class I SAM-dependent methyltransferase [Gemmatimonadaceae bacterium]|nr:class I SAM-dependent methyltransferase [Gemmatimonadaceae bacterium]
MKQLRPGGVGAELGVYKGAFSRVILEACRPSRLHLIDIDLATYDVATSFQDEIKEGTVVLHEGESAATLRSFPEGGFDFIYIDANHSYNSVKQDIAAATPRLRSDGFLIFNDYTYWSPCECMKYGVMQAVNELCLEDNWEIRYFALEPFMYCDVALQRALTSVS